MNDKKGGYIVQGDQPWQPQTMNNYLKDSRIKEESSKSGLYIKLNSCINIKYYEGKNGLESL